MSMMRHCDVYKAIDGKWYMELAHREHGNREDATSYGPFESEIAAERYLERFPNPGGFNVFRDGGWPVPTESPNGDPVVRPTARRRMAW